MSSLIKIIEIQESHVLFSCPIETPELAFSKAREFEDMGIEVKIEYPSSSETLLNAHGASEEEINLLKKEIINEIDSHNDNNLYGCTVCSYSSSMKSE